MLVFPFVLAALLCTSLPTSLITSPLAPTPPAHGCPSFMCASGQRSSHVCGGQHARGMPSLHAHLPGTCTSGAAVDLALH